MTGGIRLGGPDHTSIRLLRSWPGGLFYRPDLPLIDHTETQIERHFADGSSVFIDGDELEQYFVLRVKTYAHIELLRDAGILHAAVRGECHEGEFVTVADAVSWLKWFKGLTPQEYMQKVFARDYGFPPYGLGCRCYMDALIPGTDEYRPLNTQRKVWKWFGRSRGKR